MNPHLLRQQDARDDYESSLFEQIHAARRARDVAASTEDRIEYQNVIYELGEQIRQYRRTGEPHEL